MLFCLEGTDHSGKSTQISLLHKALESAGIQHAVARRPGSTAIGEAIRELTKHSKTDMDLKTEQILMAAEHNAFISQFAIQKLAMGDHVISDRWNPISALAYGTQAGLTPEYLQDLYSITEPLKINVLIILNAKWDIVRERMISSQRGSIDNIESRGDKYLKAACETYSLMAETSGYLNYVSMFASKVISIDASRSIEDVHADVLGHFRGA